MVMSTRVVHPVATLFPEMDGERFAQLKVDIAMHGVRLPVILWRDQIIDGRHRVRACDELSITYQTQSVECEESALPALVWSLNAQRRDLTDSQRALIAGKLANLKNGQNKPAASREAPAAVSQSDAAKLAGVSRSSVQRAVKVLASGDEDLIGSVERGEMTVASAVRVIDTQEENGNGKTRRTTAPVEMTRGPIRRLPAKVPTEQFDRVVEGLAVSSENLSDLAGRLEDVPPANRGVWAASLRQTRTVLSQVIRSLESE